MSPHANLRPFRLAIAGLSVLLGLVASGFAPPVLFDLIGRDRERWTERFGTGQEEAVIQVEGGEGFLPYVLPGPADEWAGGKPHRLRIRFTGPRRESVLLLRVAESSDPSPLLTVSVNGQEAGHVQTKRVPDWRHKEPGYPSSYQLRIPATFLNTGGNQTLTIENSHGAWVSLPGLQLRHSTPTFSPLHYLRASPPPRSGLFALGMGLFALWLADRRRLHEKRPSLLLLGAGLGMLALLGLAPWPPTGPGREGSLRSFLEWKVLLFTPRAIWLLLAVGFLAAVTPNLPRLSVPRLLKLTVFATGAIVMVLEMVGFRLLSPFFGYSVYVWGSLLGVVMGALAVGYYLGGRLADRWPYLPLLYQILFATGLLILAALYAYPAIIRLSIHAPLVAGSLLAALLLCFLPMVALSLICPFVIRVLAASGGVGVTAGRIYALSTAGSIVGTFASGFFLITTLGPSAAWGLAALLLLLLSAYGLFHYWARRALVMALLLGLLLVLTQPLIPEISVASLKGGMRIYATESEYSHLEIIEVGKTLQLVPQLHFTHTIYDEDRIFEPSIVDGLLPSFLTHPRRFLHLGMGGGALARLYLHVYPEIQIDGVDIDREMIRLGQRFLGLREDARLGIFVDDARAFLVKRPQARYDLVLVDLWQGGVFIPYYTVTREFFALGRERLTEGGALSIVIGRPLHLDTPGRRQKYDRLVKALGNTLAAVFPSVFSYPAGNRAYYFVATRERASLQALRARLEAVAIPEVSERVRAALRELKEYRPDPRIPVLTDDLAPVDQLVYDAFFRQ